MVKKAANFDDPGTYRLYYGDPKGSPGTILTFFPFADAGPGRAGPGMASACACAVPKTEFDGIIDRLMEAGITVPRLAERFGAKVMTVRDPDNAPVELIGDAGATDLHGFHSVTLRERDPDRTARLITEVIGHEAIGTETRGGVERLRLKAPGGARAKVIDIIRSDAETTARPGAAKIHRIVFRVRSQDGQNGWIETPARAGHRTTPVIYRTYFNAIHFREPGGVLFEIATDPPGFAADEPVETMGSKPMLPPRYKPMRDRIERVPPPLRVAS